jgi:hypothetical protein
MAEICLCTRQFDAAISDGEMRLKDFPMAWDILGPLAEGYHWKGMDKEAVEMRARQISVEGDLPLSAAVRRAFETGGYAAVVRCQLAAVEKRARTARVSTFELADLHGKLHERDETLALFEQGVNERDPLFLLLAQSNPAFDFLYAALSFPHPEDGLATDVLRKQLASLRPPGERSVMIVPTATVILIVPAKSCYR